jgi:hypothetical protein
VAELLKKLGVIHAEGGFSVVPTFDLFDDEYAKKIIAGEVGFSFSVGRL